MVWRFSDHWRLRTPDPFGKGLARRARLVAIPAAETRPASPCRDRTRRAGSAIKKTLGARGGIRVMGDARHRVRTIGLLPGSTPIQAALRMLPGVDAIVAGEVREWETVNTFAIRSRPAG